MIKIALKDFVSAPDAGRDDPDKRRKAQSTAAT